jgi:hypothetical protein
MFKRVKVFLANLLGSRISHVFSLCDGDLCDGDTQIATMFNTLDMVRKHTGKEFGDDQIFVRVSNKASSDDDFVMEQFNENGVVITFKVGTESYNFCKEKFELYFPLTSKRIFVKLLS